MDFEGAYSVQNKDLGYSATPSARSRRVTEWLPAFQTGFGFFSASGHSTVTERDSVGRVTRIIPPEGESTSLTGDRTVSYGFSGNPWISVFTDAAGEGRRGGRDGRRGRVRRKRKSTPLDF